MGWAAATYQYGILATHWYWIGAIPAMLFLALVMMPFYYISKAHSVPAYLKLRSGEPTRALSAISFAFMTVLMSGINMYSMALVMKVVLGWDIHFSIWASSLTVAVYVALGVTPEGTKDILGLWIETSEGAKFWLRVMNELKNRGVEDVLIAIVDGLKGFPDAITAVFPQATVQTCIVHLLRHSLDFVSWKDRKPVAAALKDIYRAVDAAAGEAALAAFEDGPWGRRYPAIGQSWRRAWGEVIPFYAFPADVRRILYTTNAIEALNSKLRRAVRARGHFPSDEAATKLLFLVLNRSEKEWIMPPRAWSMAKSQFAVLFGERFTMAMA